MARVLFVCVQNAGRSQMAEALFSAAVDGRHEARSAGSRPAERVHPEVVDAMDERGIDLSGRTPRALERSDADWADVVVTMGCGDECPVVPGKRYVDWEVDDPAGKPLDDVRRIREQIAQRVDRLVEELDGRRAGRAWIYGAALALVALSAVLAAAGVGEVAGRLSDWQAFTLGIVQGLTELLPISSSGHLILVPWLANWHYLENHETFNKTFDVSLHLGTLIAVVAYFRHEVVTFTRAWLRTFRTRRIETVEERLSWYIAAATVPAALVGAAGESTIEDKLGQPWQIAIFLGVFGILLWIADRRPERRRLGELRFGTAFAIGVSQVLALMPGVSRSGITITTGRFAGLDRDSAARFSFLLLIPVTFGAVLYAGAKHVVLNPLPSGSGGPFVVGTIASAGAGLVAIDFLLDYVRRRDYTPFVIYRLLAAIAIALIILSGARGSSF